MDNLSCSFVNILCSSLSLSKIRVLSLFKVQVEVVGKYPSDLIICDDTAEIMFSPLEKDIRSTEETFLETYRRTPATFRSRKAHC